VATLHRGGLDDPLRGRLRGDFEQESRESGLSIGEPPGDRLRREKLPGLNGEGQFERGEPPRPHDACLPEEGYATGGGGLGGDFRDEGLGGGDELVSRLMELGGIQPERLIGKQESWGHITEATLAEDNSLMAATESEALDRPLFECPLAGGGRCCVGHQLNRQEPRLQSERNAGREFNNSDPGLSQPATNRPPSLREARVAPVRLTKVPLSPSTQSDCQGQQSAGLNSPANTNASLKQHRPAELQNPTTPPDQSRQRIAVG